jgi:hypothetical protein
VDKGLGAEKSEKAINPESLLGAAARIIGDAIEGIFGLRSAARMWLHILFYKRNIGI